MHRFYVETSDSSPFVLGDVVDLPTRISHQIVNVLRLRLGESVGLFTGDGTDWTARIVADKAHRRGTCIVSVELCEQQVFDVEMQCAVSMVMALTRPQRYELALAKCAELGASQIIPIISQRVLKADAQPGSKRLIRWQRIVIEAAELSGRVRVPAIETPSDMSTAISSLVADGAEVVLLWEETEGPMLADLVLRLKSDDRHIDKLALVLGPVGGFAADEVQRAVEQGAQVASLGSRILRTETAAIAAMSIVSQLME